MAFTPNQQTALAVVPKVSSIFSLCGSGWIFVEVLFGQIQKSNSSGLQSSNQKKKYHPYHRLLLAMSFYDILESVWNFGSTWPLPSDTETGAASFFRPMGNTQTCSAQGFFLQISVAVPIYNAFLSLYYLLVINYRMTDTRIKKWVEPSMHAFAFLWGFGTAFAAAVMGYMNNANLWCWIAPYPTGCLGSDDIECTRGPDTFVYRWIFYFAPLWTSILASSKYHMCGVILV